MSIKGTLKSPDLYKLTRKVAVSGKMYDYRLQQFAARMGKEFIKYYISTQFSGRRGSVGMSGLNRRSGALKAAFSSEAKREGTTTRVYTSNASRYYDPHATPGGFTIVSSGKLMPVPLNSAQATGAAPKQFHAPFTSDQFQVIKAADGRLYLKNKALNKLTHILKRSVVQPQRVDYDAALRGFKFLVLEPESDAFLSKWGKDTVK